MSEQSTVKDWRKWDTFYQIFKKLKKPQTIEPMWNVNQKLVIYDQVWDSEGENTVDYLDSPFTDPE